MRDEKLEIIAASLGLMHSLTEEGSSPLANEKAQQLKNVIDQISDSKAQGLKLYKPVSDVRYNIANAISLHDLKLTALQKTKWAEFKKATQHAADDYWKGISTLNSLP